MPAPNANRPKTLNEALAEWENACNIFNVKPADREAGFQRIREQHGEEQGPQRG